MRLLCGRGKRYSASKNSALAWSQPVLGRGQKRVRVVAGHGQNGHAVCNRRAVRTFADISVSIWHLPRWHKLLILADIGHFAGRLTSPVMQRIMAVRVE